MSDHTEQNINKKNELKDKLRLQFLEYQKKIKLIYSKQINQLRIWKRNIVNNFKHRFCKKAESRLRQNQEDSAKEQKNQYNKKDINMKLIRIGWLLSILFFILVVIGVFTFFILFAIFSKDLPMPGQVKRHSGYSTKIYDREGNLLYDLFNTERRDPVTSEQLPDLLKKAVVAIEDKDFYENEGYDLKTILRIPYYVIKDRRVIGGSTITQQLVKNALLTNERTVSRKFKEIILAIQIDRLYTKDEIIAMYLNETPYGGNIWGVSTAAKVFFDKDLSELNLVESAFLAGLPQAPSRYSPYNGRFDYSGEPLWKLRTQGVLRRMKEDQYISGEEYDQALLDLEELTFEETNTDIQAPHFVFYVKERLIDIFGEELVERGGLEVTTTLDLDFHNQAQQIVADEIDKLDNDRYKISNGAAIVMDPNTGEIISMVGSRDYFHSTISGQFNVAVDGLRQPGSSIKPVTYLTMLRQGYTPATMLVDVRTNFKTNENMPNYEPRNYDGTYHGPVNLRKSLGSSLNVTAVKSLAIVGIENFLQQAYEMGFETFEPNEENLKRFGLAITLGGGEVHLIDTVTAYSTFANGGLKVNPVSILEVKNREGKVIYQHKPVRGKRIITQGEAFLINDILSDNNARLLAFHPNSLLNTGKAIAVKTGTTNKQKDNWTIGWSQDIMVGVWVGNNDNTSMSVVASGITGASPIWRQIIDTALESGYEAPEWEIPDEIEEVEVDALSGYPAHDGFLSRKEYVIKGTLPSLPDPIHSMLEVCESDEDKLATEAKIAAGQSKKREFVILKEEDPVSEDGKNRWQEAIDAWINTYNDPKYHVPTEYCGESGDVYVTIKEPDDETIYDEEEIEVEIEATSDEGVEKIELYINGKLQETVNDRYYKGKIYLKKGRYELYAKATSRAGIEKKSSKRRIGTGGLDWREPTPTPEPTNTPQPSSTPEPTMVPVE